MHTHHAHERVFAGTVHAKDRLFTLGLDQLGCAENCPEFQIAWQITHANFHRLAGRPCGGLHGI